jgi:hypothetical protein
MRRTVVVALLALATLTSIWLVAAEAQPATEVVVLSDIPVTPSNGFASILLGEADGVLAIHCDGGSGPNHALGGPVVPGIVLEDLQATVTRLRITSWGTNTPAVNGSQVFIGCTFEATVEAAATLRTLNRPAGRNLLASGSPTR